MSNSVRPHRRQPARLPYPWDSPGKNTGVGCHLLLQCMKVKSESEVAQWCPTLSDPMDCSPPGSSVHGIFQARALEWGAIALSVFVCMLSQFSRVQLFVTPWSVARQAPLSMGFSRQEYWSGLPFPSPGDLPDPGIEPRSPASEADALTCEPPGNSHVIKRHLLLGRKTMTNIDCILKSRDLANNSLSSLSYGFISCHVWM